MKWLHDFIKTFFLFKRLYIFNFNFKIKGPGSIRGIFGLRFSENLKLLILCGLHLHDKGNMSKSPRLCSQFCLHILFARETSTNKVKLPFFIIFNMFSAVSEASNQDFNTAPPEDQHQTSVN